MRRKPVAGGGSTGAGWGGAGGPAGGVEDAGAGSHETFRFTRRADFAATDLPLIFVAIFAIYSPF